jgi:ATP-dependent protease Clp ATPase subunit
VQKLVAGPRVYICDECVAVASKLMSDSDTENSSTIPTVWETLSTRLGKLFRDLSARRVDYFGAS